MTETLKSQDRGQKRKISLPNIQVSPQTLYQLGGVVLLLGGALGALGQVIHPTDPDGPAAIAEYIRAGEPAHVVLFFAVLLILLGLPAVCVRQNHKAGLLGLIGVVLVFFGLPLMDLVHSVGFFTLLPALLARVPDQIMPIVMTADEEPVHAALMMTSAPTLFLGTLLLAISTIQARVLSSWPAWLLLIALAGIVIEPFLNIPDTGVEYTAVLFYLGLAGLGIALLADKGSKVAVVNQ